MPVANVTDGTFVTEAWGDSVADSVTELERLGANARYAQVTASQNTISTVVDLTGLTVTFTAVAGRRYKVTGYCRMQQNAANGIASLTITNGSNTQLASWQQTLISGYQYEPVVMLVTVPGAGSITYKLRLTTNAGNVDMQAFAASPAFILVEDIGV